MSGEASTSAITILSVDDDGIAFRGRGEDRPIDVAFDGRRVWSFWMERDTERGSGRQRMAAWPRPLQRFLKGPTRLTIREHVNGQVCFDEEMTFGGVEGGDRIAVVNAEGVPLGFDKSGRLIPTFENRGSEHTGPLLDAVEEALEAIRAAGVEAFPGYGTLLGAVREGRLLGHDSDADLVYVSHHSDPVDVARESFRLQRALTDRGYATHRYSGAAFKIDVQEGDGVVRGLDVFGGFLDDGRLYLMGEVGADFEREWIFPLGTCTLEGRTFPAPAAPEHLLAATYGPMWRTPDPAFKFETPARTVRQLDGWFRGTRPHRVRWERFYSTRRNTLPALTPSPLVKALVDESGVPARVLDVGAGRCGDAYWLASQGAKVTAFDYVPTASTAVQRKVAEEGLDLEVRDLNLNEWRRVFAEGARLSREEGPVTMVANHLVDSMTPFGRESLIRLASMSLRRGGEFHLEFWTGRGPRPGFGLEPVSMREMRRRLEARGATILRAEEILRPKGDEQIRNGRMVATWAR